eukprot:25681-Chlamydomonas_euryale.AAC.5
MMSFRAEFAHAARIYSAPEEFEEADSPVPAVWGPCGLHGPSGQHGLHGPSGLHKLHGPAGLHGLHGPSGLHKLHGPAGLHGSSHVCECVVSRLQHSLPVDPLSSLLQTAGPSPSTVVFWRGWMRLRLHVRCCYVMPEGVRVKGVRKGWGVSLIWSGHGLIVVGSGLMLSLQICAVGRGVGGTCGTGGTEAGGGGVLSHQSLVGLYRSMLVVLFVVALPWLRVGEVGRRETYGGWSGRCPFVSKRLMRVVLSLLPKCKR